MMFGLNVRASRRVLPAGVGVLTQFHAWWHIFTGLGSYLHILLRYLSMAVKTFVCDCGCKDCCSHSLQIRSTYLKYRAKVKVSAASSSTFSPETSRFSNASLCSVSLWGLAHAAHRTAEDQLMSGSHVAAARAALTPDPAGAGDPEEAPPGL